MSAWAAAGAAAGSILGGAMANSARRDEARRNRQFQERMSSTAYQRAAKDLEAAGLNRILAIGQPSTTPAGSMAQQQDIITPGVSSALQAALATATIKRTNAETDFTIAKKNAIQPAATLGPPVAEIITTAKQRGTSLYQDYLNKKTTFAGTEEGQLARPSSAKLTATQHKRLKVTPQFKQKYNKTINQKVVLWYDNYMKVVGEKPTEKMIRDKYQEFARKHRQLNRKPK